MNRMGKTVCVLLMVLGLAASGVWATVVNPDGFEGYATGAWTPTAEQDGWTVSGGTSHEIGEFGVSGKGYQATSTGLISPGNAFSWWHNSQNVQTAPVQTLQYDFKQISATTDQYNYVRNMIGTHYSESGSDWNTMVRFTNYNGSKSINLDGLSGSTGVPGTYPDLGVWYRLQIEMDFQQGIAKARFGQIDEQGDVSYNDWSGNITMKSTQQYSLIRLGSIGQIAYDNVTLTPEPTTLGLLGLGGLALLRRRKA